MTTTRQIKRAKEALAMERKALALRLELKATYDADPKYADLAKIVAEQVEKMEREVARLEDRIADLRALRDDEDHEEVGVARRAALKPL